MSDRTSKNTDAVDDRNPVDVLADEFAARLRSGEAPSMHEYMEQYPEYAEQIQELFPGVALLEQLSEKQDSEAAFHHRPRQDSLPPGHRFGDIEIVREVGRGGMGIVYEGYQHSLNRSVAVKAMSGSAVHSAKQVLRFQREAQAAAQLHHTNIVPVFGVGEQEGISYYVMQLIHGLGLDAILTELVRKTHGRNRKKDSADGGEASTSRSARGFADVLVSGKLSESGTRTLGGSSSVASPFPSERDDTPTAVYRPPSGEASRSELDHRAEDRTDDRAGQVDAGDTSQTFVRSSLELKESPPVPTSVRSSLVLRDELPAGETFLAPDETPPSEVAEDPSLASLGPRYWRNVARIGLQVASGLQYAHIQGTLHRDIKPANVLLDTDGIVWIADFGLAKLLQQEDVTRTGDVVGTLRYMAPEQFHGESDARSDLYSFGLTLYELLTLRPAYDDTDRQRLIAKKLTPHDPPHPRKYHRGIPKDLETIVLKCLAWEPDRRYRSAGALVADLQAFLEDRPIQARPISLIERFGRWCKRQPLVAGLSSAVAFLLMATAILLSFLLARAENRAQQMTDLKDDAEAARATAELEKAGKEQATELIWQALDQITEALVPDRFTAPVETAADVDVEDDGEIEAELTATVLSPQSAAMMERLLPTFDKIAEIRGTDARDLERTANATRKLGDLNLQLGQYSAAADAFQRAIERYRQLEQRQGPTQESSLMLARVYNGLSVAEGKLRGRYDERRQAREALQESIRILNRRILDRSDPTVRFERASTHYLLSQHPPFLLGGRGSFRDGSSRPSRSGTGRTGGQSSGNERRPPVAARQANTEGDASQTPRAGASQQRSERGRPRRNYRISEQHLQIATGILQPLIAEFPSNSEYQFLLALCHIELSDRDLTSDRDARKERLAEGIEILEDLVAEHPTEPDYLYQLSETYKQRYFRWKNNFQPLFWQDMFNSNRQARNDLANIIDGQADGETLARWSVRWNQRFLPLLWQGVVVADAVSNIDLAGIAEAQTDLEHAVSLSAELLQQQPNVPRYPDRRLWLLFHLADVYAIQRKSKQAELLLLESDALKKQMLQRFPETLEGEWGRRVRLEVLLGYVYLQSNQYEAARTVLESVTQALPEDPGVYHRGALSILAEVLDTLGEPAEAEAARREAERLREGRDAERSRQDRDRSRSSESSESGYGGRTGNRPTG